MRGAPDRGLIAPAQDVSPVEGGFRGRFSAQGFGTKFTAVYPDRNDAVAALADLVAEHAAANQKPRRPDGLSEKQAKDFAEALAKAPIRPL